MTLKEKFRKAFGPPRITDYGCELMENVADEFAIGFMNWCINNYHTEGIFTGVLDEKELLEIYKTENNL